jgi:hypothetical protein
MSRFTKPTGTKKRVAGRHNGDVLRRSAAGIIKSHSSWLMDDLDRYVGRLGSRKRHRPIRGNASSGFTPTSHRRAKAKQNPSGFAADFGPLEQRI